MIVQCPYCSTRYQLDDERFNAPNPMLKCSRCRHVFPAPDIKKPAATKARKTPPPEDESLTLPFEKESWKDEDEAPPVPAADEQEGFVLGTGEEIDNTAIDDDAPADAPEIIVAEELVLDDEPADAPPPEMSFAETTDLTYGDDDEPIAPSRPPSRDRVVVRILMVFLVAVVTAYGLLTNALFTNPDLAKRLLAPLPFIGRFARDSQLARNVTLVRVQGGFQRIKDDKEVFVITGEAVSAASTILHNVEIRGRLFGADGAVLAEKKIYCGNVVSAKILGDLTPHEVSLLQKVAPPKEFGIRPGESAAFVIVFMDPPKGAVELNADVVGAAGQA